MSDTPIQPENDEAQQIPGELLKQAREKLGLALTDIAAQLNLQPDIIDAVERNDKQRVPVDTYFRGYIRSYARLVKVDAEMLIKLYDHESSPPPEIVPNIKQPSQTTSRDNPVVAITYLITFIMALLLLAWLMGKYSGSGTPDLKDSGAETSQHALPETQNQQFDPVPATSDIGQISSGSTANDTTNAEFPAPLFEKTQGETGSARQPPIIAELPAAINPAQAPGNALQGQDQLKFIISHDSWIEAYDVNKTKMYHGFAPAGKQLDLSGSAPFNVLLGYAPGVEVWFNGKQFDPAPYSKAGLARFTLDAKINQ